MHASAAQLPRVGSHVAVRSRRRLRVVVLREARYAEHAQPAGLIAALQATGGTVVVVEPDAMAAGGAGRVALRDRLMGADAVVARGRSAGVLYALRLATRAGIPVVDPAEAVARVRDKAAMAAVLTRAGVPTPATFVASVRRLAERVPAAAYPLIMKPVYGDNGRGLRLVATVDELTALRWPECPALAQSYLPSDGVDLKVYVIGEHLTAVHKPSSFTRCTGGAGGTVTADHGLRELARRCGRLFGLSVYGVDCLETSSGPVVVEINDFPNFTAVPDANALLAEHVLTRVGVA